jgi:hypothetical protein
VKTETTDRLLEIVGPLRASYTSDVIAAAEMELRCRTMPEADLFQRKVRRAGTICAAIGGFCAFWGALMAPFGFFFFFAGTPLPRGEAHFVFRHFDSLYIGGAIAQSLAGLLLLVGGIGLRRLESYGVRTVAGILWLAEAGIVAFTVYWIWSLAQMAGPDLFAAVMAIAGVLMSALWAFVLWLPLRFVRSRRVRQLCRA